MRALLSISSGLLTGLLITIVIASFMMPSQLSSSWGGMSQLASRGVAIFEPESLLSSPCKVLVMAAPQKTPSGQGLSYLDEFVRLGGTLVIASSGAVANYTLKMLGVNVSVLNFTVLDPLLALNSTWEISASPLPPLNSTESLVLINSSPLRLGQGASALAVSSPVAVAISAHKNLTGPFVLAAYQRLGLGEVVVVGSPYAFVDGLMPFNQYVLSSLANGSRVCVAYFAWALPPSYGVYLISSRIVRSVPPYVIPVLAAALVGLAAYSSIGSEGSEPQESLETVIARLPWANEALLKELVNERRENLGSS